MGWKRPENVPFPSVWLKFKAKDVESDALVEYVVQDMPEDRFDDAIDHMLKFFMHDEPLCRIRELYNDEIAIPEIKIAWKELLSQKSSVVCFRQNSREIVGMNVLSVVTKADKDFKIKCNSQRWSDVYETLLYFESKLNVFEHYGVEEYLSAMGLSVSPKYRGRGIATQIIAARMPFCRAFGIKASSTVFTAIGSQIPAAKNGFKTKYEESFDDLAKKGEHMNFPGMGSKTIKLMCRRID